MEWIQCFSLYIAVISRRQPERVPDLLGYQSLIIDAHREYQGKYWMGYDRRFRQRAAATHMEKWANIDPTLWSLAFAGRGNTNRCQLCFSTSHSLNNCELATDSQLLMNPPAHSTRPSANFCNPLPNGRRICYEWNETSAPNCSRLNCVYEHSCYLCYQDPTVSNKHHKAICCSEWKPGTSQRPYQRRWTLQLRTSIPSSTSTSSLSSICLSCVIHSNLNIKSWYTVVFTFFSYINYV